MRFRKFIIGSMFMFCFFPSCGNTSGTKDDTTHLSYDKKNHTLFIQIFESARYIKKIELDLKQDTLCVDKVSKKLIWGNKVIMNTTNWTIKLLPNIQYVKLNDIVLRLSDIDEYSQEELIERSYSVVTVFPKEFPCVIQ